MHFPCYPNTTESLSAIFKITSSLLVSSLHCEVKKILPISRYGNKIDLTIVNAVNSVIVGRIFTCTHYSEFSILKYGSI